MDAVQIINLVIFATITVLFSYKIAIGIIGLFTKKKFPEAKKNHKFAVLIAGRNEEKVIGQLIESIAATNYDKKCLSVFVVADNCTDNTAKKAREMIEKAQLYDGAVFERFNNEKIGKGYALDFLLEKIRERENFREDEFDAFVIFDADNLLDVNYFYEINKALDAGYEIATTYRNSKNFNTNTISANSGMMFLRECRFLHTPRAILNSSTFVSGTGFMVSSKVLNTDTGWKYTTLTEDIEFSSCQIAKGRKVTYCDDAIFYDEQPVTFKASWNQRSRWQKGFYQCFAKYFLLLASTFFSRHWFASYEMMLMIFPVAPITLFWSVFYNIYLFIKYLIYQIPFVNSFFMDAVVGLVASLIMGYILLFIYGMLILTVERKRVKCSFWQKIKYSLTYPIFIATYLPISIVCLFKKVKWKQIPHNDSRTIEDIYKADETAVLQNNIEANN
mgnify:CR=1 FL=1